MLLLQCLPKQTPSRVSVCLRELQCIRQTICRSLHILGGEAVRLSHRGYRLGSKKDSIESRGSCMNDTGLGVWSYLPGRGGGAQFARTERVPPSPDMFVVAPLQSYGFRPVHPPLPPMILVFREYGFIMVFRDPRVTLMRWQGGGGGTFAGARAERLPPPYHLDPPPLSSSDFQGLGGIEP